MSNVLCDETQEVYESRLRAYCNIAIGNNIKIRNSSRYNVIIGDFEDYELPRQDFQLMIKLKDGIFEKTITIDEWRQLRNILSDMKVKQ